MKKDTSKKSRRSRSKKKRGTEVSTAATTPVPGQPEATDEASAPEAIPVGSEPAATVDVAPNWLTILCFVVPPVLAVIAFRNASHVEFIGDTRFLIAGNEYI